MRTARTHYQVLQVDPEAEPEVIEAAYRRLARKYHPDVSAVRDAGERMREINAAHEVLRDRLRRAAYDRDLRESAGEDDWDDDDDERWAEDDNATIATAPPMSFACRTHPAASVVGPCSECGAWLCGTCFERFQPATCSPCMLAWVSQRRRQLRLPMIWFGGVMLPAGWLVLESLRASAGHMSLAVLGLELGVAYVIASMPSGWRVLQVSGADEDEDMAMALLWALALGPVVAPFRIGKALWDLRRLGELEALAKASG